jgi:hypothetical protein
VARVEAALTGLGLSRQTFTKLPTGTSLQFKTPLLSAHGNLLVM